MSIFDFFNGSSGTAGGATDANGNPINADATAAQPSQAAQPSIYDNLANAQGASYLSPSQKQSAANNALLSMGIAMMKASAPSVDPSHRNFGYILANGLEGAQQGYQGNIQQQMQNQANAMNMAKMRMNLGYAQNLFGGGQPAQNAAPTAAAAPASTSTMTPAANPPLLGGGLGSAGLGGSPSLGSPGGGATSAPTVSPSVQQAAQAGSAGIPPKVATGQSDGVIPGMTPQQSGMLYLNDADTYWKTMASAHAPTDIQKQAADVYGQGTPEYQAYMSQYLQKQQITTMRAGGAYMGGDGQVHYIPNAAPAGYQNQTNPDGSVSVVPMTGGQEAVAGSAAAKQAGLNSQTIAPTQYDSSGNVLPTRSVGAVLGNGQFSMPGQPAPQGAAPAPVAPGAPPGAATLPVGLRNNNPGNIRANGQYAQYPDMATGFKALDNNLVAYGNQGVNTVAGIVNKWAPPSDNNPNNANYTAFVSKAVGVTPTTPIDLTNPAVRQKVGAAIATFENGAKYGPAIQQAQQGQLPPALQNFRTAPGSPPLTAPVSTAQAPAPQAGVSYSAPPQGAKAGADSAAEGLSDNMNKQMAQMNAQNANAPQTLSNLSQLKQLATNENFAQRFAAGVAPETGAFVNPSQATAEKLRSSVIANLYPGGTGTDASRATGAASLPGYDKPVTAQMAGYENAENQVYQNQLKTQFLTPVYATKNATQFAQKSQQFDQNVTPQMSRVMSIPDPNARKAAVQAQIAQNPGLKSNYQWALSNGLLQ
jgi:hypothetical protein